MSKVELAAIVLAGGRSERLGGVHKPDLRLRGRSLLDHVLAALAEQGAEPVTVVGPPRATEVPVRWTREQPPGAGPVAAVAAGLSASSPQAELTALLAADLAGLRADTVRRLVGALEDRSARDCAVLADPGGRAQWLIAVWRTTALRGALDGLAEHGGTSLRSLYRGVRLRDVPGADGECRDVDTPADARALGVHDHMYWPPLIE